MKTKIFLALFFAINLLSCSKDSGDDENITFTFQVEVQNVTDRAATITWTRPEGSNISYQIFLNNEMIEDNFGLTAYTFSGLSSETTYNGKITATDGNQTATVEYFFNTNEYLANTNNSNVYLYTQEQVNEFGTHHYNELLYNLTVVGSEIYDLSPLIDLKKVHGYFELGHTQAQTFEGLNNLEFVGNNLKIYYNREVKNLNSLQSLNHIGGDLIFYSNLVLEDINGLQNLRDFEGGFQLEGSKITDLNILNDSVKLKNLYIAYNTELKTIEGFQSLTEIEEFLDIDYNDNLVSLQPLSSITSVGTYVLISSTSISQLGLNSLNSVGDNFMITFCRNLTNLNDLSNLQSFGGVLTIWANETLTDFCGLTTAVLNMNKPLDITNNLYNPTLQDFINGDCSL